MNFNLAGPVCRQAAMRPDAPALHVAGLSLSYRSLADYARRVSAWLGSGIGLRSRRVGILASRSLEAYTGILGAAWSGAAYIPINPKTPEERLRCIFEKTRMDALVADAAGLGCLSEGVLQIAPRRILSGAAAPEFAAVARRAGIHYGSFAELPEDSASEPAWVADDGLAYIIFTSGTTGVPKGVMIEAGSVHQLVTVMQERFGFLSTDRVSQASELTFDVSLFDMFMTWGAGASLHVVPAAQLPAPGRFIRDNQLTVWFSVPSTALFMERMKMLKPGSFPALRYSLFAGEALPLASAQAWQAAAPNSVVENLYGPTEATVICIGQRLEDPPNVTRGRGVLAIGKPFPGVAAAILGLDLHPLPNGEVGELAVSGRQVARGYFEEPVLTEARFPAVRGTKWYLTGDLAYADSNGVFHHLGRVDHQVKILGNRVELEEVEAHLRHVTGTDMVAALAWPLEHGNATGIVAFHCAAGVPAADVREGMKKRVPTYMVPRQVQYLDSLPLGPSGKIDRLGLARSLEQDASRIAQQGARRAV